MTISPMRIAAIAFACFLALATSPVLATDERTPETSSLSADEHELQQRLVAAFEEERYGHARDLAVELVKARPDDGIAHYNLAAANAMLGNADDANAALQAAVRHGFTRFHDLARDEHLASIRDGAVYRAIIENWPALLRERAENQVIGFRRAFGDSRYTFGEDDGLRLKTISAFDDDATQHALEELDRVAAWARRNFPAWFEHDTSRPPAWVVVALPTPEHFVAITGFPSGVGGVYDRDERRLISRDIGPSLRHEFVHALHWRFMERTGDVAPLWIQEGLATLVEEIDGSSDSLRPVASWRTNIVKRRAELGLLTPWRRLTALDPERFHRMHAQAHYAEARAIMMFIAERGKLAAWHEAYAETFDEDPSGRVALAQVFGKHIGEIEREFRLWALELPTVSEVGSATGGSLGVELSAGEGDGPVVRTYGGRRGTDYSRTNRDARLAFGDTVLAIDGTPTPTLDELYRVLGERRPGEIVTLDLRRGSLDITLRIELVEPREGE